MTTYKEYAEQHPTIQIDERLYAKAIPADLVTILESHNGISNEVRNYFDIGDGIQAVVIALDNDIVGFASTTGGAMPIEMQGTLSNGDVTVSVSGPVAKLSNIPLSVQRRHYWKGTNANEVTDNINEHATWYMNRKFDVKDIHFQKNWWSTPVMNGGQQQTAQERAHLHLVSAQLGFLFKQEADRNGLFKSFYDWNKVNTTNIHKATAGVHGWWRAKTGIHKRHGCEIEAQYDMAEKVINIYREDGLETEFVYEKAVPPRLSTWSEYNIKRPVSSLDVSDGIPPMHALEDFVRDAVKAVANEPMSAETVVPDALMDLKNFTWSRVSPHFETEKGGKFDGVRIEAEIDANGEVLWKNFTARRQFAPGNPREVQIAINQGGGRIEMDPFENGFAKLELQFQTRSGKDIKPVVEYESTDVESMETINQRLSDFFDTVRRTKASQHGEDLLSDLDAEDGLQL